jgi:hypothetical protein
VEANCHFLEFHRFKTHHGSNAHQHSAQPKASAPSRSAVLRQDPRPAATLFASPAEWTEELRGLNAKPTSESIRMWPVPAATSTRKARLLGVRCQGVAKQVLLYCFRVRNCGTFMPLSDVRGGFRIAVVWTRIVAAFSAISSVHFRVLFTHAVSLSVVGCR